MRRVGWLLLMALVACKAGHDVEAVGATDDRASGGTVDADMPAPDPTAGRDPPADDFAEHDVLPPLDGADLPGFTRERSGADVASTGDEVPILRAVRVGRHDGYDRIVFEFDSDGLPQWSVAYLDEAPADCGSGDAVPLAGDATLQVRFSGAHAHTEAGEPTSGPRRRSVGAPALRELVRTCDFEAEVTWVAGLAARSDYRPRVLDDPARLAIDIAH